MRFTDTQLKAALKKNAGALALAAADLGVTRQAVHARVKRSKAVQAFIAELEETLLDVAQGVVAEAIMRKDHRMTRWFLQTKGKHLGFTTRQEHSGPDGGAIPVAQKVQVEVTYVDSPESEGDVI